MKRYILTLVLFLVSTLAAAAQDMEYKTISFDGTEREYYLFVPENMDPAKPLVVMLHGYGGKAKNYRTEMHESARKHGFALCVPQGLPSPKTGKCGWNVRYPKQEGMTSDDVKFIMFLCRKIQKQYRLNPKATFLTGMSNGGEMCYVFAWQQPKFFRAIASVAGLTMAWLPEENRLKKSAVPFMEIHGTADKTSRWEGDPEGKYGWGPYLSIPDAMGYMLKLNRCTQENISNLPYKGEKSNLVILHRYSGGKAEVRLYEVMNGKHSWALGDMDTTETIWEFFKSNL